MTHALASARIFAHKHDELPAFHAAYLVVTVLSAALLSLGTFAVLILLHMALDYVKYRDIHRCTFGRTVEGMIRESLFDIALLATGLTFAVYLDHTMAIASISGFARSEMTLLKAAGTVLPKFGMLNDSLKVWMHLQIYLRHPHPRIGKALSTGEWLAISTTIVALFALMIAAPLMAKEGSAVLAIIYHEVFHWMH